MTGLRWRIRAAAAGAALVGCATLGELGLAPLSFEEAEDRSSELRLLAPSPGRPLGGAAIRLWARIENPNPFGVVLTEVAGDLFVENAEAIAVEFPLGLPLVARQDTVIPFDVSIGFDDLPGLAGAARAALAGERLDYRLDGTFAVDAGDLGEPRFGPWTLLEGDLRVR